MINLMELMGTSYTCKGCGKRHEEWPTLTYTCPDNLAELTDEVRNEIAEWNDDFCVIKHPEQTDRFIRCTLTQKVLDHCEDLEYGLWVSLSEKSYLDYSANFNSDAEETIYFGWLCNNIPEYGSTFNIPMNVQTRKHGMRPELVPHESHDHPFVHDYFNGITKTEAEKRIRSMINNLEEVKPDKKWWKFW